MYLLQADDYFPNNTALPLLIYKNAFELPQDDGAGLIENDFAKTIGAIRGGMVYMMSTTIIAIPMRCSVFIADIALFNLEETMA